MNAAEFTRESIEKFGEYTAFQFEGREWSNLEHDAFASRLATVLKDRGVKRGDRVPVVMPQAGDAGRASSATRPKRLHVQHVWIWRLAWVQQQPEMARL